MFSANVLARNSAYAGILCFSIGTYAGDVSADSHLPENVAAVGGNSSNSRMFLLNYDEHDSSINEAVQLNSPEDASAYPSLNSFTFFQNTCGEKRSDVIAASTNASQLVIYRNGRGDGEPICAGNCPERPSGLSTSNDQLVSVVTTGAGGSTPAVRIVRPRAAPDSCRVNDEMADFEIVGGGRLTVGGTRVRSIADSAFVRADGNGPLEEGDLLILFDSPALVGRVPKNDIAQLASGGPYDAQVLVPSSVFGKATPTGITAVPGDGANVLVTLSTGRILDLSFHPNGAVKSSGELKGSGGTFSNPRGITAGTRGDETYMIVAEQNKGRYIRATLITENGLRMDTATTRTIVSPVGAPQGVAINHADGRRVSAGECFDDDPVEGTTDTGCNFLNVALFHFSQGADGFNPGDVVTGELRLIPDTRDGAFIPLGLPTDLVGGPYEVGPYCQGFDVEGLDGTPDGRYLVLLEMATNFDITAANLIQVTELVNIFLGREGATCVDDGTRINYHPTAFPDDPNPPPFTLRDATFNCQNPSRSIVEQFSPLVFCRDLVHNARWAFADINHDRDRVNSEIKDRLEALKQLVQLVRDTPHPEDLFSELGKVLNGFVTGQSNPNTSDPKVRYWEAARDAERGALAVFDHKALFKSTPAEVLPTDTYAQLLSRFLALAFYNYETGALLRPYEPHPAFCAKNLAAEPPEYPELPDVRCRPDEAFPEL